MPGSILPDWLVGPSTVGSLGPNSLADMGAMGVPELRATDLSKFGGVNSQTGAAVPLAQGAGSGSGFGLNLGTAQLGMSGLGALGSLWAAGRANSLASKQFDFTKRVTESNMANQLRSYNTALADRARVRAVVEGQSDQQRDAYVEANRFR